MKANLLLLVCGSLLAGCQTTRPGPKPLPDPLPIREKPANYAGHPPASGTPTVTVSVAPPSSGTAEELARQAQVIEALIAQNDALTARLHQLEHETAAPNASAAASSTTAATPLAPVAAISTTAAPPPSVSTANPAPPSALAVTPATSFPPPEPAMPVLTPNADGVIDTTALEATPPGTPPNPFAVRAPSSDTGRDLTLHVQGIVTGEKPCALVNDRVVECSQRVESFRLTRLLPDALVLGGEGFALSLPLGATKLRLF